MSNPGCLSNVKLKRSISFVLKVLLVVIVLGNSKFG